MDQEHQGAGALAGKRALITAGASGIGRVMAMQFAAAGARVHVCDVSETALAAFSAERPDITGTRADVASPEDVASLVAAASVELGGLDILVNNAGIAGPTAPVEEVTPEEWRRTMSVNIDGQFHCIRAAVPLLRAAGGGSIVNASSAAGRLGYPLRSPYAASKWAVIGLTQSLAMELGPDRIRVNAILPGSVEGERMARINADRAAALGMTVDEVIATDLAQVSLRCYIPPEHVAAMAIYLCSDIGSTITGQSMNVCGNIESLR